MAAAAATAAAPPQEPPQEEPSQEPPPQVDCAFLARLHERARRADAAPSLAEQKAQGLNLRAPLPPAWRTTVLEWLLDVADELNQSEATVEAAVRMLEVVWERGDPNDPRDSDPQLAALACLLASSKVHETPATTLSMLVVKQKFAAVCTVQQARDAEFRACAQCGFQVDLFPPPSVWHAVLAPTHTSLLASARFLSFMAITDPALTRLPSFDVGMAVAALVKAAAAPRSPLYDAFVRRQRGSGAVATTAAAATATTATAATATAATVHVPTNDDVYAAALAALADLCPAADPAWLQKPVVSRLWGVLLASLRPYQSPHTNDAQNTAARQEAQAQPQAQPQQQQQQQPTTPPKQDTLPPGLRSPVLLPPTLAGPLDDDDDEQGILDVLLEEVPSLPSSPAPTLVPRPSRAPVALGKRPRDHHTQDTSPHGRRGPRCPCVRPRVHAPRAASSPRLLVGDDATGEEASPPPLLQPTVVETTRRQQRTCALDDQARLPACVLRPRARLAMEVR